ncbi:Canalicular multispecific organic anion transporter 1 [Portunus trituberculatus]|uniref:Canalicular multispecific organic anion transporter 1 n=1 Tax=Portunus trituberculatus TaxID=210409 RepID=A0A5B7IEX0_PORTR|nr:Canalicular multispecific organic anion transporter 1 [Portunus trituberculatus]
MSYGTLNAGARLHYQILHSVMHLPMHFFDTNPVGRMINRFGKDMDTLDTILPMTLRSWAVCFFTSLKKVSKKCENGERTITVHEIHGKHVDTSSAEAELICRAADLWQYP